MAFRESDGQFMWQAVHDKLPPAAPTTGRTRASARRRWSRTAIVYYVSNRGELMAVDIDGFRDGTNDGLVKDEKATHETDVDVIWRFDMMEELGVHAAQHGQLVAGHLRRSDLRQHLQRPGREPRQHPVAARRRRSSRSNKKTGKLAWEDNSVGEKILHGQWSSPAVGKIGDVVQVVIGQGDGWVRGYEALTGKKLWEFDLNPKDSVWPKTRNEVISTPVIYENVVYIANGQDPEHGEGVGHLYAIDADQARRHHRDRAGSGTTTRSAARSRPASIYNGHPVLLGLQRLPARLDVKTGKPYWTHDMFAAIWGSPMVIDGKVYLGDEDGDVAVLAADKDDEADRREQHGQLGVLDARPGQRHAVHRQSQPAVRARSGGAPGSK